MRVDAQIAVSFNSRLREEATGGREIRPRHAASFNSRLREEATVDGMIGGFAQEVSTHASVRRRPDMGAQNAQGRKFQLTPP